MSTPLLSPQLLTPQPLTVDAFRPFGEVISTAVTPPFAVNGGSSLRHHALAPVDVGPDGQAILSIFDCQQAVTWPVPVPLLEYHPLGSQAFVPMDGQTFVIVVAPPGPPPTAETLCAFVTSPGQGVNYRPGVWHLPLASFSPGPYLVADRRGPGSNLVECTLTGISVGAPAGALI